MTRARALTLLVAGILLAVAVQGTEIRVAGTDLLGPGLRTLLGNFARDNDITITQQFDGTRPALDRLRTGDADLGLLLVPPGEKLPEEHFIVRVIAYQPVVFVVSENLPLKQLTIAQVRGIFAVTSGDSYSKWGDLGLTEDWRTTAIEMHVAAPRSALTVPLMRRLLLEGAELKSHTVAAPLDRVLERVRSSANCIGAVPRAPAVGTGLRTLALAATVKDSAHLPTAENLHDGSYPARIPLCVVFRREAAPRLLVLLRHLLSDESGEILAESAFVPLPVGPRNQLVFELEELN